MAVNEIAAAAYKSIALRKHNWTSEEEVRIAWVGALETALEVIFDAERARKDASYNNVIIEFKAPGLFKGSVASGKFNEAMEHRLLPYIIRAASQQGLVAGDYIGVAIDGNHICFAQVIDGSISHNHLLPFSPQSVGMVIEACRNNFRRAVTAENLLRDFGNTSDSAATVMQALADSLALALEQSGSSKIRMLFQEWRELYGQVADMTSEQRESIDRALRFEWRGEWDNELPAKLFVIHTYNSLVIKLLAAEIVSAHKLTSVTSPAESFCALLSDAQFVSRLESDIERGDIYKAANIDGFVEEAIFSWHLDAARGPLGKTILIPALRALIGKLALYRADRLSRQRDALRDFYQGLVPETLRKSLGEFYTPDWLVDFTVSSVEPENWLGVRTLDPTCGSGSFLVAVARRKRAAALAAGWDSASTIRMLCDEVWGFDLNPLAVQTARVNFLMEIADLLADAPGTKVELPVLLADAIYSPAPDPDRDDGIVEYKIGSQVAALTIYLPSTLAFDRIRLDGLFEMLGELVEKNIEYSQVSTKLIKAGILTREESVLWAAPLKRTYDQVLDLHRKNWNGIWFRIIRNFFWSATAGKFDRIVGNPPWVRWSKLPQAYRERVKPTCEKYDIFSQTGHHGGNELDISAMITYTTGDKWLKADGKLAFVITQTLFQNPSSAGFRNFRIDGEMSFVPLAINDLKAMKPFPDAANKTAVAVFEKSTSRRAAYPVPYVVWDAAPGFRRAINPASDLDAVLKVVKRTVLEATPVADDGSPWAILPKGRFAIIESMAERCSWVEGRKGITVDLNGVYFVPIEKLGRDGLVQIRTRPSAGKKDIGAARTAWVEADALYPLIKGASDFEACYVSPAQALFTFVPNKGIRKADYQDSADQLEKWPNTRKYFRSFTALLEARSTWRGRMKLQNAPNHAIYNVGKFTFEPWKVIWAEMPGRFCAAVAGSALVPNGDERCYVPDHKIFFAAFNDERAAHYLCGLLNTSTVAQYVEAHNVAIQVGDIFKHMTLPELSPKNKDHLRLIELSQAAHREDDFETRNTIVEELRGLGDKILEAWLKSRTRAALTNLST